MKIRGKIYLTGKNSLIFLIILAGSILTGLSGCSDFRKDADISGLNDIANTLLFDAKNCTENDILDMQANSSLLTTFTGYTETGFSNGGKPGWSFERINGKEIEATTLISSSGFFTGDKTMFYLFKPQDWDGKKAILWAPGFGISDFAFCFIKNFFIEEMCQGYAVLFYVLPYHLIRIAPGKKEGQGLITADVRSNLTIIHSIASELNQGFLYLKKIGVEKIGGWGGSIGASALYILSVTRKFDHLAMMIPILNWNTLIFHTAFAKVLGKITNSACNTEKLSNIYLLISPVSYISQTTPERTLILFAESDQLTPAETVTNFSNLRGIKALKGYPETHASILLNGNVYRDYAEFLSNM